MKNLFLFLAVTIGLYSCSSEVAVKGVIEGMPSQQFRVEELAIDQNVPIDSGKTNEKGEFEFQFKNQEEALYRIKFEQGKYILLALNNGENVNLKGNWNNLEDYTVDGSKGSIALKSFLINLRENINDLKTLSIISDSAKAKKGAQGDSLRTSVEKDIENINNNFMLYIKKFADTTQSVSSALFAVNMINPQFEGPYVKEFYKNITKRFPKSSSAQQFAAKFLGTTTASNEEEPFLPEIGSPAPDFTAPTPQGEELRLSSLKGKYVLIDFWASWCGPCRKENPNVVNAYNSYKDKNFTIIGVSLDSNKDNWMAAITKDNLTWIHVSELQGWQSVIARNYGVTSIPTNFLIDPTGKIIAKDLRGEELSKKLQTVLMVN